MKAEGGGAIERDFSAPLGNTTEAERGGGDSAGATRDGPDAEQGELYADSAVHGLTLDRHETADYGIGRNDPWDRSN
jgi:hypothetical protein